MNPSESLELAGSRRKVYVQDDNSDVLVPIKV